MANRKLKRNEEMRICKFSKWTVGEIWDVTHFNNLLPCHCNLYCVYQVKIIDSTSELQIGTCGRLEGGGVADFHSVKFLELSLMKRNQECCTSSPCVHVCLILVLLLENRCCSCAIFVKVCIDAMYRIICMKLKINRK